jgi:hypothetical protein
MIAIDKIRECAMALPGATEGPAVRAANRIAAFKVGGKSFAGVEKGGATLTLSFEETLGKAIAAEQSSAYEEISGRGGKFMGLRVDLSKVSARRVCQLIEQSWRFCAPKQAIAAYGGKE